jgi:predicted secreted protein
MRSTSAFKHSTLLLMMSLTAILTACSTSNQPDHRIIELQAQASHEVNNDEAVAILYTQQQAANPQQLNQLVQQKLTAAFDAAKKYPTVKVSSGSQNTAPIYNQSQRITGWTTHAEIILKSTDLKSVSELLGTLQDQLMLQSLQFQVSSQQREKVESELISAVSKKFQQRATIAQNPSQASDYEVVKFKIWSNTQTSNPMMQQRVMLATDAAAEASSPAPIQAGQSQIVVEAIGSIQLN